MSLLFLGLIFWTPDVLAQEVSTEEMLRGSYYEMKKPGDKPELFAAGFISSSSDELNAAFSPDGKAFYFSMRRGYYFNIFITELLEDGSWSPIKLASFSGKYSDADPVFNKDGSRLYYCTTMQNSADDSSRDFNIAYVDRNPKGWGDPVIADFCTELDECFVSFTEDEKQFYFHRRIEGNNYMFLTEKTESGFTDAVMLPEPLNSGESEWDPMISPDGSYLMFSSSRIGNLGRGDLYVSFNKGEEWTDPVSLGRQINSPGMDYCPSLSPDGKYLFYSSYRYLPIREPDKARTDNEIIELYRGPGNGYGDIYWVSTSVIEKLKRSENQD